MRQGHLVMMGILVMNNLMKKIHSEEKRVTMKKIKEGDMNNQTEMSHQHKIQ
jgi:hypothetical protein